MKAASLWMKAASLYWNLCKMMNSELFLNKSPPLAVIASAHMVRARGNPEQDAAIRQAFAGMARLEVYRSNLCI